MHDFSTRVVQLLKDQIDTLEVQTMRVGYKRVSTFEQRTDPPAGGVELDKVFEDKCSGKDLKRPQWAEAERYLREGDVLLVHSMDRLSRRLADLLETVERLVAKGVEVRFVHDNLIFEAGADVKPMGKLLLSLLGIRAIDDSGAAARGRGAGQATGAYKGGSLRWGTTRRSWFAGAWAPA
ncbi:MAG: recombinase family protein [Vulcanimicrobiota bacterium]